MADKTFGITVTGDISDVQEALNNLLDTMSNIVDKIINITANVDSAQLDELQTELDGLDNQTLNESVDVESSELDTVEADLNQLDNQVLNESVDVESTELDTLETDLNQLDGQVLNETIQVDAQGIEEAKADLQEMGAAGEIASSQIENSMDGATVKIGEVGNETENATLKTEELGDKSEETGDKAEDGMGKALLAVVGLTTGLELAAEAMQDLNNYFDKVASTEIPEQEWRDLFASLSNAKFPVEEVRTYITLLKQMGVTSEDELARGATAMNTMRLATGASVDTMGMFASSIAVMGVDLNNLPSIFNAVAYAQANVVGGFEAYVQWMRKFDADFKEMGLSVDQTAIIIAAATKKWGGGRAAYQGLNEAMRESGGNLDVLEEKLGLHNNELDRATEITGQYSGKVEKNSGIVRDNTTATQEAGDAISDLKVKYGDLVGTLLEAGAFVGGIAAIFGGIIPGILKAFDSIWGTGALAWYKNGMNTILGVFRDLGSGVLEHIKGWIGWGDEAGKAGGNVFTRLTGETTGKGATFIGKIKDFGSQVLDKITGWHTWTDEAGNTIIDLHKGMSGNWTAGEGGILGKIGQFGQRIGQVLGDTLAKIKLPKLPNIGGVFDDIIKKIPWGGLAKVGSDLGIVFAGITAALEIFWHGADLYNQNIISSFLDLLGIDDILKAIGMGAGWESFKKWLDDSIGTIRDFVNTIGGIKIGDMLNQFFTDIQTTMQRQIDFSSIQGFFGSITEVITAPFRDIYNEGPIQWLQRIVLRTIELLAPWGQAITERIFGIGDIIVQPFRDAWNGVVGFFTNLQGTFNGILGYLSTIPAQIGAVFNLDNFNAILDSVLFHIGNFAKTLYELPGNIYLALQGVYNTLVTSFTNALTYLSTLPEQFMIWATNIWNGLVNGFNSVLESLIGAIGVPQKLLTDFIIWVQSLPEQFMAFASNLWIALVNGFNSVIEALRGAINNVPNAINGFIAWIQTLPGTLYNMAQKAWQGIVDGFNSVIGSIRSAVDNVHNAINGIVDFIKDLPGKLYSMAQKAWKGLVDGFNSMLDGIRNAMGNVKKRIEDGLQYIKDLPGKMWEWGSNTIKSWVDGLKNWIFGNWEGFRSWLNERLKHLWDGWESHSPPKALPHLDTWGENLGKTYIESVKKGIEDNKDLIDSSLAPLKDSFNISLAANIPKLSNLTIPSSTMDAISNNTNRMQTSVNFGNIKVDVSKLDVSSPEATEESVDKLFNLFMAKVKGEFSTEMTQRGLNPFKLG